MTDLEFISWLRFFLGDIDESVISDSNLQIILDLVQAQYSTETDCRIKYEFTVSTLEWLIRNQEKNSADKSGSISKIREKSNRREKEVVYESNSSIKTGWDKILDDLKNDPNSIGCKPFSDSKISKVVIGGGDMYSDPYTSKRNRDEAAYNARFTNPWRPKR